MVIFKRIDRRRRGFRRSTEGLVAGHLAIEGCFRFRHSTRRRLRAAKANTRIYDLPGLQAIRCERCRHGKITGAAAEFIEAEPGVVRQQWQTGFDKQLVFGQCR